MKRFIALLLCAVVLGALIWGGILITKKHDAEPIQGAGTAQNAVQKKVSLTYKGTEYPIKTNIQTVLLIGTDSYEQYEEQTEGLKNFYNAHQADVLMLLVLDKDANIAQIIQLNRDTMTDVPWLDVLGMYGGTEFKQLCLAFNYGDGGGQSCRNTIDAVSRLLFDAPIDSYIQIPITAIPVLNDLVGGVPVTITDDMTVVDPAFVQGTTIRLTGSQAEKFVRARMALADDTNLARMRRQRDYMDSFQKCAKEALNTDSGFVLKLLEKMGDYLQSNLTGQQLSDLIVQLDQSQILPIRVPEGELIEGSQYYEFYVDEASLWEIVRSAYCE